EKSRERSDMTEPVVSTIVVNYNGSHLLPDCLGSLQKQDVDGHEIIVVDNGSIDESAEVIGRFGLRLLALGRNYGLPAAYNRGAEIAAGRYLFFVNNDMRFEPDCVRELADALAARPGVFASDPMHYDWD